MFLIIWFILLSCISGYRDMARFFYKGTWDVSIKAKWLPYWEIENSNSKLDPFHAAGGLMWALIIILIFFEAIYHYLTHDLFIVQAMFILGTEWYLLLATLAIHGAVFWLGFYWNRNIFMHIIGVDFRYARWKYLWPPVLLWIWNIIKGDKK